MTGSSPEDILNDTTLKSVSPHIIVRVTEPSSMADLAHHVGDGVFLQTKTAQGIAGAFVWVALFLTCQQVINNIIIYLQYTIY